MTNENCESAIKRAHERPEAVLYLPPSTLFRGMNVRIMTADVSFVRISRSETHEKLRSLSDGRLHGQRTLVLPHDLTRQTQTNTRAGLLRREKWNEDLLHRLRIYTVSVILHGNYWS